MSRSSDQQTFHWSSNCKTFRLWMFDLFYDQYHNCKLETVSKYFHVYPTNWNKISAVVCFLFLKYSIKSIHLQVRNSLLDIHEKSLTAKTNKKRWISSNDKVRCLVRISPFGYHWHLVVVLGLMFDGSSPPIGLQWGDGRESPGTKLWSMTGDLSDQSMGMKVLMVS